VKRPSVSPEERRARKLVRTRSGGACEGCDQAAATNCSHRISRGVGGLWCPANLLHLCGSGTTGCHGYIEDEPTSARDERGWRLESTDIPTEMPVLLAGVGWALLDANGGVVQVDAESAAQAFVR
jgi:hypothetical protein